MSLQSELMLPDKNECVRKKILCFNICCGYSLSTQNLWIRTNNQNFMLNLNGDFPLPCTSLAINSSKCTIRPEKSDYDVVESPDYYSLHAG